MIRLYDCSSSFNNLISIFWSIAKNVKEKVHDWKIINNYVINSNVYEIHFIKCSTCLLVMSPDRCRWINHTINKGSETITKLIINFSISVLHFVFFFWFCFGIAQRSRLCNRSFLCCSFDSIKRNDKHFDYFHFLLFSFLFLFVQFNR